MKRMNIQAGVFGICHDKMRDKYGTSLSCIKTVGDENQVKIVLPDIGGKKN